MYSVLAKAAIVLAITATGGIATSIAQETSVDPGPLAPVMPNSVSVDLFGGAFYLFGGDDTNYGYNTTDFSATITPGEQYDVDGLGWTVGGDVRAPVDSFAFIDSGNLHAEYWEVETDRDFNRATTLSGNFFGVLPIIADPVGAENAALFNTIHSGSIETKTSQFALELTGFKMIGERQGITLDAIFGIAGAQFKTDTNISIAGLDVTDLSLNTAYVESSASKLGPVIGLRASGQLRNLNFEAFAKGLLYFADNDLEVEQFQSDASGFPIVSRTQNVNLHDNVFAPELLTGLNLTHRLGKFELFAGGEFRVITNTPRPLFPTALPGKFVTQQGALILEDETLFGATGKMGFRIFVN